MTKLKPTTETTPQTNLTEIVIDELKQKNQDNKVMYQSLIDEKEKRIQDL
jgi:hypothetical protein